MNESRNERRIDSPPVKKDVTIFKGAAPSYNAPKGPGGPGPDHGRHHDSPPRRHRVFSGIKPVPIPVPIYDPIPPRRYRVIHRYGLGYDYGYGYEYGYTYDPDYYLPYDPQYVDNKRKIAILAGATSAVALGGIAAQNPLVFGLGVAGVAASSIAAVVNNIKRRVRYENQQREEYERRMSM